MAFVEWKGGELPRRMADVVVRVRYRNGMLSKETLPAGRWKRWKWGDRPDAFDIVAVERIG